MNNQRRIYANPLYDVISGGGGTLKALSIAVLAGCFSLIPQNAYAAEPVPVLDRMDTEGQPVPAINGLYSGSAYTLTEVTPDDAENLPANVIKYYDPNNLDSGIHYYEVNLKASEYGQGSSAHYYKWQKDENGVKLVETDNSSEAVLTIRYNPEDRVEPVFTVAGGTLDSVNNLYAGQDIKSAIGTKGTIENVTSTFVGNTLDITEEDKTEYNYTGVLSEYGGKIGNINSSFIGNTINVAMEGKTAYGGLVKSLGEIDNLNSEFIANRVNANTAINGGLVEIATNGVINNITSDFIKNSVEGSSSAVVEGGVIGNEGRVNIDTSRFIENYMSTQSGLAGGGAIYNAGNLYITNSVFEGNYVKTDSGSAIGGAIRNTLNGNIENSIFRDNYALSNTGNALGGAIYTDMDFNISANSGKLTEFTGNYVINNGVKENQAIYVDNKAAVLTLTAGEDGRILLNDKIDGEAGYRVVLTGDETGRISLYNSINNANITAEKINVDLSDGKFFGYDFLSLYSKDSAKYSIDIDFTNKQSDRLTLGAGSSGVITISGMNIINGLPESGKVVQILTAPDSSYLTLTQELIDKYAKVSTKELDAVFDKVKTGATWNDVFYKHNMQEVTTEGIRTAITAADRTNADSIEYFVEKQTVEASKESMGDTLRLVSQLNGRKSFNPTSANQIYTVTEDLGAMGSGRLDITGKYDAETQQSSTIDANGHTLFELTGDTDQLYIQNVNIINPASSDGAILNIQNENAYVNIIGQNIFSGTPGTNGIINNGTLALQPSSGFSLTLNTSITGTGTLKLSGATGKLIMTDGASIKQNLVTFGINNTYLYLDDNGKLDADVKMFGYGHIYMSANGLMRDITLDNGVLNLNGGTLTSSISGAGTTNLKGDIKLDADISSNIGYHGTITTNADHIKGNANWQSADFVVNLTGGTLEGKIANNGTVNILNDVIFAATGGTGAGTSILINEGTELTINNVTGSVGNTPTTVNGTLNLLSGSWSNNGTIILNGSGTINILGDVTMRNCAREIKTNALNIGETGVFHIDSRNLLQLSNVVNDGIIDFYGIAPSSVASIKGKGHVEVSSVTTNNGIDIFQDINVKDGVIFTVSPNKLHGEKINNEGTVSLYTGTLTQDIIGGTTVIWNGQQIINEAILQTDITINHGAGSIRTNADLLQGDIRTLGGRLKLTGGTLTSPVYKPNAEGVVDIYNDSTVTYDAPVEAYTSILENAILNTSADNLANTVTLSGKNSTLNLTGGTLNQSIEGNQTGSSVHITGDVTMSDKRIVSKTVIDETGILRNANSSLLGVSGGLENNGQMYLHGDLSKKINGTGTTYIDETLKLGGSAGFDTNHTFNLNNGLLRTTDQHGFSIGTATGTGNLSIFVNAPGNNTYPYFDLNADSDAVFNITSIAHQWHNESSTYAPLQNTTKIFHILRGGSNAYLTLDENFNTNVGFSSQEIIRDTVGANVFFDDPYQYHIRDANLKATIELATTQTPNDSLKYTFGELTYGNQYDKNYDLLHAWATAATTEERNFNFRTADDVYTAIENTSVTTSGTFNINGVYDAETGKRSVIDYQNKYSGIYDLGNSAKGIYNVSNVKFQNVKDYLFTLNSLHDFGKIDEEGNVSGGIQNSVFDNIHGSADDTGNRSSGVLYGYADISQIKDSIFSNNAQELTNTKDIYSKPNIYGSAIYMNNTGSLGSKTFNTGGIINSVFENNSVTLTGANTGSAYGGAIAITGGNYYISNIIDSEFRNNTASAEHNVYGGAIFNAGTIHNIENTKFIGNSVTSNSGTKYGSAISNQRKIDIIKDSLFQGNSGSSAIYNSNAGTIGEINNVVFKDNLSAGLTSESGTVTKITNSHFIGNQSIYCSGLNLANTRISEISHSEFKNNIVSGNNINSEVVGALRVVNSAVKTMISDIQVENNTSNASYGSDWRGAGVFIKGSAEIRDSEINNNTFNGYEIASAITGGGLQLDGNIDIYDTNITGNTINNEKGSALGGGIRSFSTLSISGGKFENNSAIGGSSYGGAICKDGSNLVVSDTTFRNNSITSKTGSADGGAIRCNAIPELSISNSLFEGNHVINNVNSFTRGGAIWTNASNNIITNTSFKNNYVINNSTGSAYGAAIWVERNGLSIIAEDNGLSEFTGNYVISKGNEANKDYQALYFSSYGSAAGSEKVLTLNANTGGHILMNDGITGDNNYKILLTGDNTGKISLYNYIKNSSQITAEKVNIDTADGKVFDYSFRKLIAAEGEDSAKFTIDVDFANQTADNFTVTAGSTGTVFIDNLNVINPAIVNTTVQIIKGADSQIQLALNGDNLHLETDIIANLGDTVYNNVTYHQNAGYTLATTNTTNDSITQLVDNTYDALSIIGASTNNTVRNFVFQSNDEYNVITDLDPLAAGTLNVNGIAGDTITSVINSNGHSMFKLSDNSATTINISDVTINTSEENPTVIDLNGGGTLNLANTVINGDIISSYSHINLSGRENTLNGVIDAGPTVGTYVDLREGDLRINTDTLAKSSLYLNGGRLVLSNDKVENYNICNLAPSTLYGGKITLDLDLANRSSDIITSLSSNSTGKIKISNINYMNSLKDRSDFVVQVLHTNNNNKLSLVLDENINRYEIEKLTRVELDEVQENTDFSHVYYERERKGSIYGDLYLATTSTTNDSLGFKVTEAWETSTKQGNSLGDTLKLVNESDLTIRNFNSTQASDVYFLSDDLAQTSTGTLSINGTLLDDERSTVDLKQHKGFTIGADTVLNVNNARITGNDDIITVTDNSGKVNLNNAYINGNIIGEEKFALEVSGVEKSTVTGNIINADVTLNRGGFSVGQNTFADENTSLTVNSGSIYLDDDELANYNFSNLTSGDKSKYSIDIDLEHQLSDTITAEGSGTVVLDNFNVLGGLSDVDLNEDYTIQILKTSSDSLQLQLSETVQSQISDNYKFGTNKVIVSTDVINPVSNWKDLYYQTEQDWDIYGKLNLSSKETTNDSLHLYDLHQLKGEERTIIGDTLKLISRLETTEKRQFVFDTANDRYLLEDNIGTVSEGNLALKGVAGTNDEGQNVTSVIDMQGKAGFGISKETELTVSNVQFENATYKNGSLMNISNPNAVVNFDNVTVTNTTSTSAITNAGTINMTGEKVVLDSGITGSGVTNVTGADVILAEAVSLTQKEVNVDFGSLTVGENGLIKATLNVAQDGSAIMAANALTSKTSNAGNITITEGTIQQNITGNGTLHTTGDVINNAKLEQNVDVQSGTLTTSASNISGTINNDDKINLNGTLSTNVTGNGITYVNENLKLTQNAGFDGTLNLNNGIISAVDNVVTDYNIGKMLNHGSFRIDVDFTDKTSDKFISGNNSNGTVYIDSINFLNLKSIDKTFSVQVLDTNGTENLQLALNPEISNVDYNLGRTSRNEEDSVNRITNYNDIYHTYLRGGDVYGNLTLGKTLTENDSIVVTTDESKTVWDNDRSVSGILGDTLALWNQLETTDDKQFIFDKVDTYTVSSSETLTGLGTTKGSKLTISGVSENETTKSTINLNNKTGFELTENSTLNIANTKITNAKDNNLIQVSNANAAINLNNVYLDGNISGSEVYLVNIKGKETTTLNGILKSANTTLTEGTLKFNTETFANESDTLTTQGGNIELSNNKTEQYNINDLSSNEDTKYSIDIDLTTKTSDKLVVKTGTGRVLLDNLNILADAENINKDYKIQILDVTTGDIQLALSETAKNQLGDEEYLIGQRTVTTQDAIKEVTNWKDVYNKYNQEIYTYGVLDLVTTKTENDSIGIKVSNIVDGDVELAGPIGDTLMVVNTSQDVENKIFEFDTSKDEYTVNDNLGKTYGTLTIKGVSENENTSKINMNGYAGFEISENNELNISNTEIKNAQGGQGSVINAPVSGGQINLTNVTLLDNTSTTEHGGAIYSASDVNITADNGNSLISGNKTTSTDEAVYLTDTAKLTLNALNSGKITINDSINGQNGYNVKISGDETGHVYLNNKINNAAVEMNDVTLHLLAGNNFETSSVLVNSGVLDLVNGAVQQQIAKDFIVNGDFKMNVDADLANVVMDRLPQNTTVQNNAIINVDKLNLISDTTADSVAIPFAYKQFKDNVKYIGPAELSKDTQITAFAPIYKYNVRYESREDQGYFVFGKGAGAGQSSFDSYNPAVLASPVATQAAGQSTMNETFRYVFEHADAFTQLPSADRFARINANKYALASTDFNNNLGEIAPEFNNKAGWSRSYATFEKINLNNGPKVNSITYGTLAGFDTDFKELKHGWTNVATGYIGYHGAQLNYSGVDTTMNGGLLGLTETFYKGNFWTALTATAGAGVAESRTMYGKEDTTMLMAGIGSKTGYNLEFKEGKFIVQPIMFLSYTFVNTFDYTNAAGVRIDSDPMHTVQINPSVRFIGNMKNGWQPYASVGMVWNLLNETNSTANGVKLPEMHTKPYVEYGLGLQRRWADKFTAFGQAMIRNGGRNGIALTAGFRWALGKEGRPIEKVSNPQKVSSADRHPELDSGSQNSANLCGREQRANTSSKRDGTHNVTPTKTVIKQLSEAQRTTLGTKAKTTTRTVSTGILKPL